MIIPFFTAFDIANITLNIICFNDNILNIRTKPYSGMCENF